MDFLRRHTQPPPSPDTWRIERVPTAQREQALALVVGAGRTGPEISTGVRALAGYLSGETAAKHELWWAREADRPLAAALAAPSPGRTAVVLYSTTDTGLISAAALSDILAAMSEQVLAGGATLVQALLSPTSRSDIEAFERAGFFQLAELIYMRQCLRGRAPRKPVPQQGLSWLHYTEQTHDAFAEAILASYRQSLDCPALDGLRTIDDILAGHKAAGVFRPDLWTLALVEGKPAGVVLLNQNASQNVAEIIYMGVAQAYRGQGIGRAMLAKATELAVGDRFAAVSLAVDAGNHFAYDLYLQAGFVETSRRLAYVRTAGNRG